MTANMFPTGHTFAMFPADSHLKAVGNTNSICIICKLRFLNGYYLKLLKSVFYDKTQTT
jgi:hypothetical protein